VYSGDKVAGTDPPEHKDDDADDYNEADYAKAGAYANEHQSPHQASYRSLVRCVLRS
jgi:hypothetical protein